MRREDIFSTPNCQVYWGKSMYGNLSFLLKGVNFEVLEIAAGATFRQTRFSLVWLSIQDLFPDRNPYYENMGLGVGIHM